MATRRERWLILFLVVLATVSPAAFAAPIQAKGKIDAVTLYRDRALVTRTVSAEVPAGTSALVVGALPEQILPDSLFADAPEGTQVRAVRFRTKAVEEEPREEVRKLDEQIETVQDDLKRNDALRKLIGQRSEYLGKLESFVAPTAQVEMTKGVLNADTLKALTIFSFDQREELAEELLKLHAEERDLKDQLKLLGRKRSKLTAGGSRTVREAVIFVDRAAAGTVTVRLSYVVREAGWDPTYNLRAGGDRTTVTVEYNATVYQLSGEDWDQVELKLSTASPMLMARGPELAPFWVALVETAPGPRAQAPGEYEARAKGYQQELKRQEKSRRQASRKGEELEANWQMSLAASGLQNIELLLEKDELGMMRLAEPRPAEGLSAAYQLPGRLSVENRADRQIVQVADVELQSEFYLVATPLLTSFVYREAQITNNSQTALLRGPANCYLDGRFVGRSTVPLVGPGQKFPAGFGMNSQFRASRELTDKTDRVLGGNREQTLDYRLTLENFGDQPTKVRLYDRIPTTMDNAELRVTLGEMSDELSDDPLYLERERPRGILRWDVEVQGKAAGPDARKVDYIYKLEFDRKLTVVTPGETGQAPAVRERFEEQMLQRETAH